MNKETTKYKRAFRPYDTRGLRAHEQLTLCICPQCEKPHKMKMRWIGRGMPRKFCEKCKARISSDRFGLPEDPHYYTINERGYYCEE